MMRSLYSGVAGLKTHQTRMDVIGNNIANVNTTAFKSSSVNFEDVMYQNLSNASGATATTGGVNAKQIGLGVTTGATKISITNGGSAQSTGDALDIRLADGKATNFFIVNNGSKNLFTRSGSFYLDSAGNLAMTTTGFQVMGWQTTKDNQGNITIQKDMVSALHINSPENQTSNPEATTQAHLTGLADKTDTNMTSEAGKTFTLNLYDNLGYSYTARFSMKVYDEAEGTFTVKLTNIYDDNNTDVLDQWEKLSTDNTLDKIFGDPDSTSRTSYSLGSDYSLVNGYLCYTSGGKTYYSTQRVADITNVTATTNVEFQQGTMGTDGTVTPTAGTTNVNKTISDIYGYSGSSSSGSGAISPTGSTTTTLSIDSATGKLIAESNDTNVLVKYNTADGTFSYVIDNNDGTGMATEGGDTALLKLSALRNQGGAGTDTPFLDGLRDITMDFSATKDLEHSGNATVAADGGTIANNAVGRGKALGNLTGLSIAENGMIYGSYSNGNTTLLGQIAVAQFSNASGLESVGNNCYDTTLNSGDFDGIGTDITSDGGKMKTGQLEMSNVDLAQEFTDMITTQRGFQANSRIITVSDTLLEELTNLKR